MYRIEFSYGVVSGVLPEKFTDNDVAQEHCDYENKLYNNVNHRVIECQ